MVQKATFRTKSIVPLDCIASAERKLLKTSGVRNAALDGQSSEIIVTYDSLQATLESIQAALDGCEFRLIESTETDCKQRDVACNKSPDGSPRLRVRVWAPRTRSASLD